MKFAKPMGLMLVVLGMLLPARAALASQGRGNPEKPKAEKAEKEDKFKKDKDKDEESGPLGPGAHNVSPHGRCGWRGWRSQAVAEPTPVKVSISRRARGRATGARSAPEARSHKRRTRRFLAGSLMHGLRLHRQQFA